MDALGPVLDPQMRKGVVELGMVRSVRVRRRGVQVHLVVPAPAHPDLDELVRRVRAAAEQTGAPRVDVTVETMDEAQLRDLRRALAGDPVETAETVDAAPGARLGHEQGRTNPFMRPGSRTRVLGISSGKGGVGKSSVSVNLAVSLAQRGHEVAILDADVYGFSVPKMLGIDHDPMVVVDLLVPPVAYGVRCVSMGFFVDEDTPVIWRGPMLHKALEQFLVDVHWGDPDYLVVDMPPGTGDVTLSMSQYLPKAEVLVVTTPQPAAQRVAQRSAYAARKLKLPLRGVIENMSWFLGDDGHRYELFGHGGGAGLAADLGIPLLAQVPLVPDVRAGGDLGVPVTVSDPGGEASAAFHDLADRIESMGPARVYRRELSVH